ncbi:MAG: hypothetical protein GY757_03235 [bacterium]|nr:hypothetical protein [bacterium]
MRKFVIFVLIVLSVNFLFAKVVTLPELTNPNYLVVDAANNCFFVTDGVTVHVYSLDDFKLKKKFGREGEGPQEFKSYAAPDISAKQLIVNSRARLSFYTRDGEYVKEINAKGMCLGPYLPLGDQYVNTSMGQEGKTRHYTVNFYDSQLKMVKTFGQLTRNEQQGKKINAIDWGYAKFRVYKDRVYCEELDNQLFVFDKEGKKVLTMDIHSLVPGYKKVKVSEEYKTRFFNYMKARYKQEYERVKTRLIFPEYFTVIRDFLVSDGKIYIMSFKKKGAKTEILIFDTAGKYEKTVFLPGIEKNPVEFYPLDIRGGKLYTLFDNDETNGWELHIEPIK